MQSRGALSPEAAALLGRLRELRAHVAGTPAADTLDGLLARAEALAAGEADVDGARWEEEASAFPFAHSPDS